MASFCLLERPQISVEHSRAHHAHPTGAGAALLRERVKQQRRIQVKGAAGSRADGKCQRIAFLTTGTVSLAHQPANARHASSASTLSNSCVTV